MAFTQGRYGVEFSRIETETHHLRTLVCVSLGIVGVAFACYKITRWRAQRKEPPPPRTVLALPLPDPATNTVLPVASAPVVARPLGVATNPTRSEILTAPVPAPRREVVLPPPQPAPTVPPAVRPLVRELQETEAARPQQDQILIRRYAEAERQGNVRNAIDALKKLYDRPSMADQSDPLMRRLGDLNLQMLFSGKQTPWTKTVTVRRGDGRERLAREHRTTTAALVKLNPTVKWEKLKPGDLVTVLEFPNAVLVIRKQTGAADLSLRNEKFFRRYYLTAAKDAKCTSYAVQAEAGCTLHARFKELGVKLSPVDRAELEMFLGPGSRIVVQE